jgi:hypothetical protein
MEPQQDKPQDKEPVFNPVTTLLWVVAVMLTIVWVVLAGGIGAYVFEVKVTKYFEYAYVLREGVELKRGDPQRPLYDLIVPPSQTGRPVAFVPVGRGLSPSLHPHDRPQEAHEFPGGATLALSTHLTAADQSFLKDAFASQRGARFWVWLLAMAAWLAVVVLPPAFVIGLIWFWPRLKFPKFPE